MSKDHGEVGKWEMDCDPSIWEAELASPWFNRGSHSVEAGKSFKL